MNQKEYDDKFGFTAKPKRTWKSELRIQRNQMKRDYCTTDGLLQTLRRRLPIFGWLPNYNIKMNFMSDLMAGATLGIYNIPQGMAYSVLTSLPPVYGLYASFFPPLLYALFGSSRHSSIGVFSLTCLMAGRTRLHMLPDYANGTTATEYKGIENLTPIDIVSTLAFLTGAVQIIMSLLRLDFLTSYLSDSAVSGLTFGAAIQAFVTQIPGLMDIKLHEQHHKFLKIFYNIEDLIELLGKANLAAVTISIISIITLVLSKIFVEPRTLKIGFPFPTELILLIIGTAISEVADIHNRWNVKIINHVPVGMPSPSLPRVALFPYLIEESISIAIVAFAVTVSMGKLFARKHKYPLDSNQELLALGGSGLIASLFKVFPTSTSLSRTLVNEGSGAKTQISGIVSSMIILSVILWIGPLLEKLPMCILSSIVVVALRSLLMKITEVPRLWRFSKFDVIIWIATAIITICYDIIEGLVGGMIVALMLVVIRTQWPGFYSLGEVSSGDYHVLSRYKSATIPSSLVIRFDASVIFTNAELFKQKVRDSLSKFIIEERDKSSNVWNSVVLDCSTWTYTDMMGVEAIKELNDELKLSRILLLMAKLKSSLRIQYARAGLLSSLREEQFFPSIDMALISAQYLHDNSQEYFKKQLV